MKDQLRMRAGWSNSTMSAWRRFGSLATNEPIERPDNSDQTVQIRRLSWVHWTHTQSCRKCCAPAQIWIEFRKLYLQSRRPTLGQRWITVGAKCTFNYRNKIARRHIMVSALILRYVESKLKRLCFKDVQWKLKRSNEPAGWITYRCISGHQSATTISNWI